MKSGDRTLRSNRQRYQIWKSQKGFCALCGEFLHDQFEIDHIDPVVAGGKTQYQNLQAVHGTCNRKKGGQKQ